ncbi:glycosyl hydrolase family 88 [Coriobacterium glomerans PW2]|uniref:Glycosyl hydrolase family 88 n=1 Tax=Coriobacterium glomerans (strain ATCC 49209 / DSM 20642 / JCM 10262 / PW2) TaxID=700015 RepID=F2NB23_CORGP|nr:glycosyl hydrolase family 88 [Coriobacterium glomerans PW2]
MLEQPFDLNAEERAWTQATLARLTAKLFAECDRVGSAIPYIAQNGAYREDKSLTDIVWWTNGFWPGILWQLYHLTGNERYAKPARAVEEKLDRALDRYTGLHHDVGFMWLLSAVADFRLTGNERSEARGLHASHLLAGRYNPRGRFIRSWNRDRAGWVIVDSMMNIPLLYWAAERIGDPRFTYIACDHADTVLDKIVRPDGSCNHIIQLDPATGALLGAPAGQGCASGSSWSRGQSWAIYGFALSYRHTGDERYLCAAKRVANYFTSQVALTGDVALLDFRQPAKPVLWDALAGCIATCGLLEIAEACEGAERASWLSWAMRILRATDTRFCDWDIDRDGIVQMCSGAYHCESDRHVAMVYADYYLLEVVLRLLGKDARLW